MKDDIFFIGVANRGFNIRYIKRFEIRGSGDLQITMETATGESNLVIPHGPDAEKAKEVLRRHSATSEAA
jgi:hypothetical protein